MSRLVGNVYFIQEDLSGPIKIGYTRSWDFDRMVALQAGNYRPLQLLGMIPGQPREAEAQWHQRFAHVRLKGEWFHPSVELLLAIEDEAVIASRTLRAAAAENLVRANMRKDRGGPGLVFCRTAAQVRRAVSGEAA